MTKIIEKSKNINSIILAVLFFAIVGVLYEFYVNIWASTEPSSVIRADIVIIYPILIAISVGLYFLLNMFNKAIIIIIAAILLTGVFVFEYQKNNKIHNELNTSLNMTVIVPDGWIKKIKVDSVSNPYFSIWSNKSNPGSGEPTVAITLLNVKTQLSLVNYVQQKFDKLSKGDCKEFDKKMTPAKMAGLDGFEIYNYCVPNRDPEDYLAEKDIYVKQGDLVYELRYTGYRTKKVFEDNLNVLDEISKNVLIKN